MRSGIALGYNSNLSSLEYHLQYVVEIINRQTVRGKIPGWFRVMRAPSLEPPLVPVEVNAVPRFSKEGRRAKLSDLGGSRCDSG